MASVVADTHVIFWYFASPERLSPAALAALEQADSAGEPIYISAISVVEIVYLIEKQKLPEIVFERLTTELADSQSGLVVVPLDLSIAKTLRRVSRNSVPEMADRIIAATALYLDLFLITKDAQIRTAGLKTIW